MKKQLSTNDFKEVYKGLDINIQKLGCMMLDLETLQLDDSFFDGFTRMYKFEDQLYYTKDKEKFWIDGYVGSKTPEYYAFNGFLSKVDNIIKQTLSKREAEIREKIEKLKKDKVIMWSNQRDYATEQDEGYNDACDDILSLLQPEGNK